MYSAWDSRRQLIVGEIHRLHHGRGIILAATVQKLEAYLGRALANGVERAAAASADRLRARTRRVERWCPNRI